MSVIDRGRVSQRPRRVDDARGRPTVASTVTRVRTLLIALMVCLASTYCACARTTSPVTAPATTADDPHACCQSATETAQGSEQRERPHDHNGHDCPHCTGSASLATPSTTLNAVAFKPAPVPHLFVALFLNAFSLTAGTSRPCTDPMALPPPSPPSTLLDLACSLTT